MESIFVGHVWAFFGTIRIFGIKAVTNDHWHFILAPIKWPSYPDVLHESFILQYVAVSCLKGSIHHLFFFPKRSLEEDQIVLVLDFDSCVPYIIGWVIYHSTFHF